MTLTQPQIDLPERYRVLHRVATGGMATVWAAADEILGREVAIKVLAEALAADESARERFMREARTAARVSDHPNVATIYDVGETGDDPPIAFIVMELLTGGTLAERLKSGAPIPHTVALGWLEQAAAALDAAHAVGIVHRDVKPANLLLDPQGTLKVGDFGIATIASESSLTQTGQVVGTAAYLSPEQAQGRPATDASDRYALGVVAYELVTGRRPFTQATPAAQALAHVEHDPEPPSMLSPGLPAAVDATFERVLAKDPSARPATATQMVDELAGALGPTAATGVAVPEARFQRSATPSPVRPRTPRPAPAAVVEHRDPRSRLGLLAIAAAVLLLVGVAVAALSGGADRHAGAVVHRHHAAAHRAAKRKAAPANTTPQTTSTAATPPASGVPADAAAIEQQAHAKIAAGDYAGAIGPLGGLVKRCPVAVTNPCAYAWYDLGYALLHNGQAAEAIPVLEQRLQNPDQQGVVQATLDQARAAAAAGGGGPAPKPGKGPGHGKGHDKLKGD